MFWLKFCQFSRLFRIFGRCSFWNTVQRYKRFRHMQQKEQRISPIKQRILQFAASLRISKRDFYTSIGVSRGTLESATGITEDVMAKFFATYPQVSIEWVISGNGSMLKQPTDHPSVPEKQLEMTASGPVEPRSNAVQTPIRRETRQQKADPSPDVILSLLETIRQQAEEIGMLKERLRASEEERAKLVENAQSSDIADAG